MKTFDWTEAVGYDGNLCPWAEMTAYKYKSTVPTTIQAESG